MLPPVGNFSSRGKLSHWRSVRHALLKKIDFLLLGGDDGEGPGSCLRVNAVCRDVSLAIWLVVVSDRLASKLV